MIRFFHSTRRQWNALLLVAATWFLAGWSFFDPFHEHVEEGNRKAKKGDSSEALVNYESAGKIAPESPIPDFNRGIVLSQKGDVEEARAAFQAAQASDDKAIAADAHYNLGNLLLQKEDAAGAIEEYLRSLDLDPADPDAQRNLEIAIRKQQQQQQQQQQDQQKQKQDPSKQDQKEKEDQEQRDESGDKKENEQKNPEQGKKDEEQQQQKSPGENTEEEKPQNPDENGQNPLRPEERLSREDAARLLNAIQNDELKVLRALEEKKGEAGAVGNDW